MRFFPLPTFYSEFVYFGLNFQLKCSNSSFSLDTILFLQTVVAESASKYPCFDWKNLEIVFNGSSAIFIMSFTLFHACLVNIKIKFPLATSSQIRLLEKKIWLNNHVVPKVQKVNNFKNLKITYVKTSQIMQVDCTLLKWNFISIPLLQHKLTTSH